MLVIDAPPEMAGLAGERLLSSDDFLKAFAGVSPKSGLRFADFTPGPSNSNSPRSFS
jgi:hypothetical protein